MKKLLGGISILITAVTLSASAASPGVYVNGCHRSIAPSLETIPPLVCTHEQRVEEMHAFFESMQ